MGRIISGSLGSLRLASPARATRPTTDRVRESLFGLLEARDYFTDARVLDLYAGTGALALEAISRGAIAATLVERDRQAQAVARANIELAQRSLQSQAIRAEISLIAAAAGPTLQRLRQASASFDLIFVDPPYELSDDQLSQELLGVVELVADHGLVVIERAKSGFSGELAGLEKAWQKTYGDTTVLAFQKSGD